jgi:hypothetical protein
VKSETLALSKHPARRRVIGDSMRPEDAMGIARLLDSSNLTI